MGMAGPGLNSTLHLTALLLFSICVPLPAHGEDPANCGPASGDASGYHCTRPKDRCRTFAVLHANPYYSSISNLTHYFGLSRSEITKANPFATGTDLLPKDQPLLIPIKCRCNQNLFGAELVKTWIKGESFVGISKSLEGLTTCKGIEEKNPSVPKWDLGDGVRLVIPLKCACPSPSDRKMGTKLFLSYPVRDNDTVSTLAFKFNTTSEAVVSANNISVAQADQLRTMVRGSSLLIPVRYEPVISWISRAGMPIIGPRNKKRSRKPKIGISIGLVGVCIVMAVAFITIHAEGRKKGSGETGGGPEVPQIIGSSSARTAAEKKVSFDDLDLITSHHNKRPLMETYTLLELKKATEDFTPTSNIEGAVFHGRLNGKNLAIKRLQPESVSKLEFRVFRDPTIQQHPNILRLLGTCLAEGPADMFLVFEFAKNGSLKDWLRRGLAVKTEFIASYSCFLTWKQRLRVCLDVASALQFMHHDMCPSYVHRNIKSRNIFLDEDFNAKVGNVGLSNLVQDDKIQPPEQTGYLAPEYVSQGAVTPSMDIFAYGVVLMEVLCGQPPMAKGVDNKVKIKSILDAENKEELLRGWMDTTLGESYSFDAALALAALAKACLEEEPSRRPSAMELVERVATLVEDLTEARAPLDLNAS